MTGFYVRAQRDNGNWEAVEIEELTDTEWARFIATQPPERAWAMTRALCGWIKEHVWEWDEPTQGPPPTPEQIEEHKQRQADADAHSD